MDDQQLKAALRIAEIITGFLNERLTEDEETELYNWVNQSQDNFDLFKKIADEKNLEKYGAELRAYDTVAALEKVKLQFAPGVVKSINRKRNWYIAAAAAIVIFLSATLFFFMDKPVQHLAAVNPKTDIAPGGNKAILTLAGGKTIVLNGAKNGTLAQQGSAIVNKTVDGEIVYKDSQSTADNKAPIYNTITTPRGGQYHLILADGTNVWLNAASSIKYPTAFKGDTRLVEITGEAYFEVAHNPAKPFRVTTADETVEVLGTHFNVNAYTDEPAIKTTLLEGSVKVANGAGKALLVPGQQAQAAAGQKIRLIKVDTEQAVAWKNNYFLLDGDNLESIMRKVSRWYDVDVVYQYAAAKTQLFSGTVSRLKNVSEVLQVLQETGAVHFRVEAGKIIVVK